MIQTNIKDRAQKKDVNGFTLIELLIAIAISAIFLLVLGQFFISTNETNTIQEKVAGTQMDIRAVMEIMTRDVRMAGLDPSKDATDAGFVDNGDGDIDTDETDTNSIAIKYDHDGDGNCEFDLCYAYTDQTLMFSTDGGANFQPLTEDGTISSMSFNYTVEKNDGTTTIIPDPTDPPSGLSYIGLEDIRSVTINMCGQVTGAYSDNANNNLCFSNTVTPRNM